MKFSDQQTPEDIALEQQLRAMQPAPLSKTTLHRLEQSLESAVFNDKSNSEEQDTILQLAAGKDGSWRPVLWSMAAMLMIGLWLISLYLPGQSAEQLAQARQHIPAGKEIVLNQHSPEIQTVSNNPSPAEATVEGGRVELPTEPPCVPPPKRQSGAQWSKPIFTSFDTSP